MAIRKDALSLTVAALVVTAGAQAQSSSPSNDATPTTIKARFMCKAGKRIDATFINAAHGSVKLALSDGRKLTLPQASSGSGARYADKGEKIVFWNKGDTAFLEESGKRTYDGCATKR